MAKREKSRSELRYEEKRHKETEKRLDKEDAREAFSNAINVFLEGVSSADRLAILRNPDDREGLIELAKAASEG